MNFNKKSIAVFFLSLLLGVGILVGTRQTTALATYNQEKCGTVTTYEKHQDYNDSKVDINFGSNDKSISVSAESGYSILKVYLDVDNDGHSGYYQYSSGPLSNFNPAPGDNITKAKVEVIKNCPSTTPTLTPTVTPTLTTTPSITPTPTEARTEPTPSSSGTSSGTAPAFQGSTTEAPKCGETAPTKIGANFHIYRKGEDVIAKWFPTEGNRAHIYYQNINDASDVHALRDIENDGYEENLHLLGSKDWRFGLQQANGCAGGPIVWVDDANTVGWTLFR